MGKGDKRTKRGKIFKKSFGKSRMKLSKLKPASTTTTTKSADAAHS